MRIRRGGRAARWSGEPPYSFVNAPAICPGRGRSEEWEFMRRFTLLLAALLSVPVGCHPSPEPETVAEAETLDVLRFESVAQRWVDAESPRGETYRRLVTSTPVQKRNEAVAIMAETLTSRPMVPVPGGQQVADGTQKVADAAPVVPVEKVTDPLTDPLSKPKAVESRVLLLEVVDASGNYHNALVHTAGMTPPPAFKDVAGTVPLAAFKRIDPIVMSLMEDAGAVNAPASSDADPLIVMTYFDGGAWDAVAFRTPMDGAPPPPNSAAAPQPARFSQVAAFALEHLPPEVANTLRPLAR